MVSETIQRSAGQQVIVKTSAQSSKARLLVMISEPRSALGNDFIQVLNRLDRDGLQTEIIQDEQVAAQDAGEQARMGSASPDRLQIVTGGEWAWRGRCNPV